MSRRALSVLSAIVLGLAVVVLLDRPKPVVDVGVRDRILVGFVGGHVKALRVERGGAPVLALERGEVPGTSHAVGLLLTAPARYATDEAAVRDLLGSLEYLAFRRRLPAEASKAAERGLDAPRVEVVVTDDADHEIRVRVGKTEPALGRTWVQVDAKYVYLVDEYAARALDVGVDDLRRREPFHFVADEVTRVVVARDGQQAILVGRPPCVTLPNGCAHADPARVGELLDLLGELKVTRFAAAPDPDAELALRVGVGEEQLSVYGDCPGAPGERLSVSAVGPACIPGTAASALATFDVDPVSWVGRGLLTMTVSGIEQIELVPEHGAAATLIKRKGSWELAAPAGRPIALDPEGVRAWLVELASYRASAITAPPTTTGGDRVIFHGPDGLIETLTLSDDKDQVVIRRDQEPIALVYHPAVKRYFHEDPLELRDRRVLSFDGYALREVELDDGALHERAVRGDSADDWKLTAPLELAADPVTIAKLRDAASSLRARKVVVHPPDGLRFPKTLTLVVDPPPGSPDGTPPARQVLELGAPLEVGAGDCDARRAGDETVYLLAAETCAALGAHLATRSIFSAEPDDVTALTIAGTRYERHGPLWYGADGNPLEPGLAAAVGQAARLTQNAPVVGYGELPLPPTLIIETGTQKISFRTRPGELQLEGRKVIYGVPRELCARWPILCLGLGLRPPRVPPPP